MRQNSKIGKWEGKKQLEIKTEIKETLANNEQNMP